MDLDYYYTKRTKSRPDQGYAWVVAIACFMINFLLVGISRSVGILFVGLVEAYEISREQAALPFSIRVALRNLSGPLIGLLGLKYGIRAVTTAGGFVAGVGGMLCYFAPNVMWITVFWGLIHGMGFGLSTVLHMMTINQYFDKYKATALGLGYSGDCFGTFAFPVIMEYLLSNYDVKGTFLILGGIVFNVIPMALLLKKPPWLKDATQSRNFSRNITQENLKDTKTNKEPPEKESIGYQNEGFLNLDEDLVPYDSISKYNGRNAPFKQDDAPPIYQDVVKTKNNCSDLKLDIPSISGSIRSHRKNSEVSEIIRESMVRHDSLPPLFEKEALRTDSILTENRDDISNTEEGNQDEETRKGVQHSSSFKKRTSSFVGQMAQDIVNRMRSASFASQVAQDGFIMNIEPHQKEEFEPQLEEFSGTVCQQVKSDSQIEKIRADSIKGELMLSPNTPDTSDNTYSYWSIQVPDIKKLTIFQSLIKTNMKPIFVLISISMAVYAFLFVGVLTIIIDYATDQGVSKDEGKYLIIGFSVADLIGRLSFGQVIDRKLLKIKNYAGMTMLLMGTLVASLPLNKSFNFMIVCMCLYGLFQGGTAIMFPILVGQYMDKNEESVAMGCLNFYGGLLMLTMAPMIGYFRDNTGSYNGVFHILGGTVAVVGLIWQLEPVILKFQRKQILKKANYIIVTKL